MSWPLSATLMEWIWTHCVMFSLPTEPWPLSSLRGKGCGGGEGRDPGGGTSGVVGAGVFYGAM